MSKKTFPVSKTNLRRSPVARACLSAVMAMAGVTVVHAGAGFGDSFGPGGQTDPIRPATYYAHSPSGQRDAIPAEAGTRIPGYTGYTGKALRKFVDTLPGVGASNTTLAADSTASKYIPVAAATDWIRPDGTVSKDDYYEIAVVQYKEKMHSDLANATTLRGYVQLTKDTSKFALKYPDNSPILIQDTDDLGKLKFDASGNKVMVQAYATDKPHYLGPAIVATKGKATRIKFHNLLPVGRYDAAKGRGGDLFIPVDETLPGAGVGPDGVTRYTQNRAELHLHGGDTPWISDGTPHQWVAPAGETALLAAEMAKAGSTSKPAEFLRGASAANVPDMNDPGDGAVTYYYPNNQSGRLMWYHDHTFGLTRLNAYVGQAAPYVLHDPKQHAMLYGGSFEGVTYPGVGGNFPAEADTLYWVIQDKTFVPDDIKLQDAKWNLDTKDTYLTKPLWGEPGDLWYPHVYEVNQDPNNGADGTNPVGRWDWGPFFWPVFPALYNLPTGRVGDVTLTPEAWMDTPVVNGVAYPTMTVDPKAYRIKILNGANDRFWNLSLFVADSQVSVIKVTNGGTGYNPDKTTVTLTSLSNGNNNGRGTGAAAYPVIDAKGTITAIVVSNPGTNYQVRPTVTITDTSGTGTGAAATADVAINTEVKMVPAIPTASWPSTWPTDGRDGGVPDPTTSGPSWIQIGTEGGLLPQVAEYAAAPVQFEYNRRSITVLNTMNTGLYVANAERADTVVDFSAYAGKTLILYNDAPAPVPAFDPRNDHWTGKPDESMNGSVETPRAGFGPNTRTIMQIKVAAKTAAPALDVAALRTKLPAIYGATQEAPVVGQEAYKAAFVNSASAEVAAAAGKWSNTPGANNGTNAYATIFTGSLQDPTFKFLSSSTDTLRISVDKGGSGYITPPKVTITAAPGNTPKVEATATAALRIAEVTVIDGGAGYLYAPTVTFTTTKAGTGAAARAWLGVNAVAGLLGGSGYTGDANGQVKLMFSEPQRSNFSYDPVTKTKSAFDKAANTAWGLATVVGGAITGFKVISAGNGYTTVPLLSMQPYDPSTGAALPAPTSYPAVPVVDGKIAEIQLVSNDPNFPDRAGGMAYEDISNVTVAITAPSRPKLPLVDGIPDPRAVKTSKTGAVADVTLVKSGSGYTAAPTVTFTDPTGAGGVAATATAVVNDGSTSMLVKNKAIQELFDPTYGRMNATLGIEIPFTSALTQTTIPLGYVDPVSEEFNDGETQIWKITHNGVDSHPVHFHLLNVQVINRVGWDGTIKPPADNELGWKETIKMNPLEDILVAVRAKKPELPKFGLPLSERLRDPSQPAGVPTGFTQIDVKTGLPKVVVNEKENYGWEYVWHCHILGHEENDFMRPVKFNANEVIPVAPTNVTSFVDGSTAYLSWTDNAVTEYQYRIERTALDGLGNVVPADGGAFFKPAITLANSHAYSETIPTLPAGANSIKYRVVAVGAAGEAATDAAAGMVVLAPTALTAAIQTNGSVAVGWAPVPNATQYLVQPELKGVAVGSPVVVTTNSFSFTPASVAAGDQYTFKVAAQAVNASTGALVSSLALPSPYVVYSKPAAVTALTASAPAVNGATALSWTAPVGSLVNQYLVEPLVGGVPVAGAAFNTTTNSASYTPATVVAGQVDTFRVTAQFVVGSSILASTPVTSGSVTYVAPARVGTVTRTLQDGTTTFTLSWAAVTNATGYVVTPLLNGVTTVDAPAVPVTATPTTVTTAITLPAQAGNWTFQVVAQRSIGTGAPLESAARVSAETTFALPGGPGNVQWAPQTGNGLTSAKVSWTQPTVSPTVTGYTVVVTPGNGVAQTVQTAKTQANFTGFPRFLADGATANTFTVKVSATNAIGTGNETTILK